MSCSGRGFMTLNFRVPSRAINVAVILVLSFHSTAIVAGDRSECTSLEVRRLSKLCPEQLEDLYRHATADGVPVGYAKGRPLLMLDYRNPKLRASMTGTVWKGKHFRPDGTMINQWAGFKAIDANVSVAPSSLDGLPCIRLDYSPDAPIFGNSFDEIREITPCVFLGCFYERCPTPRLKGYFALVMTAK